MGKIEELIEGLENVSSKSINKDFEDGYNGGIRHALELVKEYKSSLPTQQDKVVVKQYIADWYEEHRYDTLETKFRRAKVDKDKRVREWYDNCQGRHANKRANAQEVIAKMDLNGYTVEKEQLYIVKVGELAFVDWEDSMLAKMTTMDSPGWVNEANHFTTKVRANEIAKIIGGEAVPVMEDE